MEDDNYEMMFKVVLVGDSFVGKTNIMSKYLKNEFHEDSKATVGVEFGSKEFNVEGHVIKAQIWDTAGQERYKAITSAYYKGAKGAFVVYDITRKSSFESIDKWISDLQSSADKKLTVVVIGNKCDLEDQRQITKEQGEEKASKLEVAFLETSAFSGENLDKAFEMMINEVYKKCHEEMLAEGDVDIEGGQDINLNKKPENPEPKKCCA
jgi:small GTP-binding protein